jgi:secondary thiamine-phosphate synthase enzyme
MVNENADPDVRKDITGFLEKLVPEDSGFAHSEGNSDSHIKAALCGNSRTVIIENGVLALGTWEGVYFAEFDGPRKREVWVKIIEG